MASDVMTAEEVAAWLRVPVATLYAWRYRGHQGPPSGRVGKFVRYRRADVECWLADRIDGGDTR
jgi:predicted DNA-binding transcriptional regulator AlpA